MGIGLASFPSIEAKDAADALAEPSIDDKDAADALAEPSIDAKEAFPTSCLASVAAPDGRAELNTSI
jgi:hypothetical protein